MLCDPLLNVSWHSNWYVPEKGLFASTRTFSAACQVCSNYTCSKCMKASDRNHFSLMLYFKVPTNHLSVCQLAKSWLFFFSFFLGSSFLYVWWQQVLQECFPQCITTGCCSDSVGPHGHWETYGYDRCHPPLDKITWFFNFSANNNNLIRRQIQPSCLCLIS